PERRKGAVKDGTGAISNAVMRLDTSRDGDANVVAFAGSRRSADTNSKQDPQPVENNCLPSRGRRPVTMEQKLSNAQEALAYSRATLLKLADQLQDLPPDLEET